ncbi:hypothetical protein Q8W71_05395 [Methylobacterium sp. NEAU 140]|uniref:SMODS domain-containing nucleotidyltransferase n=1 Tax=Methylobacterium sp. NEAU 140 TaxID=3064945 RepID=UPI002735872E|nr:hypothetical protein [Methylobacterium sp. NEAU 140]MDP4022047.1 hypothetical protein [Methylobacterium sp. NEAU 140]
MMAAEGDMWVAVTQRFARFHADLNPTAEQVEDAIGKAKRVGQALERAYGGEATDAPPVFAVGSWGKGTQVRSSTDIDIMVRFDASVFQRFHTYACNGQSALLQEIKERLETSYPQTRKRGDGQVVQIDFNSILVELVPVFPVGNGQFVMPDTNGGGTWKTVDPIAQINHIDTVDREHNGNVRALAKMIKRWKHEHSVDLKSYLIEFIVADFVQQCGWGKCNYFWYDWLMRDCFKFLRTRADGQVRLPGTSEIVPLGNEWVSKVDTAIGIAETACVYERLDLDLLAGMEWQKIFGPRIPMHVL